MGDWEEQLNSILGDPGQMKRIAGLARSLMGEDRAPSPPTGEQLDLNGIAGLAKTLLNSGDDDKRALLEAMKPWLSEKRRRKMNRAMQIARMAKLAELAAEQREDGDV